MEMFFIVLFINVLMAIICAMIASSKKGYGSGFVFFFYGLLIWPIALTHAVLMNRDPEQNSKTYDGLIARNPYHKLSHERVGVIIEGKELIFSSLQDAEQALGAEALILDNNPENELVGKKFEAKYGIDKAWIYVFLIALAAGAYALKETISTPEPVSIQTDYNKEDQNNQIVEPAYRTQATIPVIESLTPNQWLKELRDIEIWSNKLNTLSEDQISSLSLRAARATGAVESMRPAPRGKFARLYCTMAAQALRNYLDDMNKGHLFSSEDQMKDFRENKPKCLKELKK